MVGHLPTSAVPLRPIGTRNLERGNNMRISVSLTTFGGDTTTRGVLHIWLDLTGDRRDIFNLLVRVI